MDADKTRVSVIERARRGDADEFAEIYVPLGFAMARKLRLSEADTEDVVQQTMLEVLSMIRKSFVYDRTRCNAFAR